LGESIYEEKKDNDLKAWELEDLAEEQKKEAIDAGCEPGKNLQVM